VVTLDTTLLGWRPRDLDLAFLPFLQGKGIAQYTSDPVFAQLIAEKATETPPVKRQITPSSIATLFRQAERHPGSFWGNLFSGRGLRAVRKFVEIYSRPSISWQELPFLRQHTRLPILLKGVLHADDARKALDMGMDGLIVSNHGGRQVDGAVATLEALPDIAQVVGGKIPVLLDSGIRSGADAFKAIALGADAVCLGRPYAYALGIGGEKAVREVLANFKADFDLTMGLSGCAKIGDIQAHNLRKADRG
jgi:lactate 2-monooxygenase